MKSATLPSLRVDPNTRRAAESVLHEGETLSSFVDNAVRRNIQLRMLQKEFISRGLQSLKEVEEGAETYPAEHVHAQLDEMLANAERKA